ncbi:MAG: hypothetical protein L7F78_09780 [Syntrophales bacterium LBB04]|nr:hypothetical protein [Syntrophales bacterium LBB04]
MTKNSILMNILAVMVCSLILLFAFSSAYGATYYVSTSGDDSNIGGTSSPWRTIQKCANTINGGDICILRDGTYTENVSWTRSGTAGSLMHLKAENIRQAVIVGNISMSGNYVKVEGMKIVLPDGYNRGIKSTGSNNAVVDCYVTTNSTSLGLNNIGIELSDGSSYGVASGNYVEKLCFAYILAGSNHTFLNNEATLLKLNGNCGDVDYMRFFGSNHVIRNNYFHGINMNEIGGAHVDCFQTFDNGGPQTAITNVIVEGNYCSDAAQGMMLEGKVYNQSSGLTIRNNVFTKCGAWCICNMDIADVHIINNTCDTTGGIHGMWCRGDNNRVTCEFKNNIVYGTGTLYGVFESAMLIDGTPEAPGKNNLLYKPGQVITGYSNDIVNKDPLFFSQATGNYRLQLGSPAIDAGMAIIGWAGATDRDGKLRPQGSGWDIGAYEYRATSLGNPRNFRQVGN